MIWIIRGPRGDYRSAAGWSADPADALHFHRAYLRTLDLPLGCAWVELFEVPRE